MTHAKSTASLPHHAPGAGPRGPRQCRPAPTAPPRPRPRPGAAARRAAGEVILPPPPPAPVAPRSAALAAALAPAPLPSANPRLRLSWRGLGRVWRLPWGLGWVRHILRAGEPYLDRFSLRRQGPSGTNPWRIYLHRFWAPDGPGHHNHPSAWSFSIVLWGSYTEEILEVDRTRLDHDACHEVGPGIWATPFARRVVSRRVRWFNWITADRYHRIAELHPGPGARGAVWTLFICGPLTGRGWGWAGKGHVPVEGGH